MPDILFRLSGTYGQLRRKYGDDDPRTIEALGAMVTAQLVMHITDTLATAPPLTPEQAEQIRSAVTNGGGH
jgi:hypothetical protein